MSNLSIKERKSKPKFETNKREKKDIQHMVDYINKCKTLKTKVIGSSNKNKCTVYHDFYLVVDT